MLTLLKIQNLALIDELLWEPGPRLTSITGETGAGKSVIIGALSLILGERADKGIIRSGETTCTVEALFELTDVSEINRLLSASGLPECEDNQLIIRRIISHTNNKQFVNHSPATLTLLKELGEHLIDLHGSQENKFLFSPMRQGEMLDTHGKHLDLRQEYTEAYSLWCEKIHLYEKLKQEGHATDAEIELLTHQVSEIESADLTPDEESSLLEQWQRAKNSSKLQEAAAKALHLIQGDDISLLSLLSELQKSCNELERLDPSLTECLTPLTSLQAEIADLSATLYTYSQRLDINQAETTQLEERINVVESLKRKYGRSIPDILTWEQSARQKLNTITHRTEHLSAMENDIAQTKEILHTAADKLTQARQKAIPVLEQSIQLELQDLGFRQSIFAINLTSLEHPCPTGNESLEFFISPNPGEPLKPLRQIASSGETARIMLAIKSSIAQKDAIPLLVFDEIDANVGGEIARCVGQKMANLGNYHQVISITHFPQVAALSDHHFLVKKHHKNGRTVSSIQPILGEARISELARMLGGENSPSALAHAHTLLKNE